MFSLVFTPPYCPDVQPIELFWAHGKNFVASQYCNDRQLWQCRDQIRIAWYGGLYTPVGADGQQYKKAANCAALINQSNTAADLRVDADEILSGSVLTGLTGMTESEKCDLINWDTRDEIGEVLDDSEGVDQVGDGVDVSGNQ